MADEVVYKKMTRKADAHLEGKVVAKHGKQGNQRLKTYIVLPGFPLSIRQRSLSYPDDTPDFESDDDRFELSFRSRPSLFVQSQTEERLPQFSNFFEPYAISFLPCFRPTAFLNN